MSSKLKALTYNDRFDHGYLGERFVCLFAECVLRGSVRPVWFKHVAEDMVERGWMNEKNGYYYLTQAGEEKAKRNFDVDWMVKEELFHQEMMQSHVYKRTNARR